jgi:hypothetical protein
VQAKTIGFAFHPLGCFYLLEKFLLESETGSANENVLPLPNSLSTQIRPP